MSERSMRRRNFVCAAISLALVAIPGCGDGNRDPGPVAIDVSILDSGNYPTIPRDLDKLRLTRTGAFLESIRIGNAALLPFEIDGRYAFQRLVTPARPVTSDLPPSIASLTRDEYRELAQGVVAGWGASAERRPHSTLTSSVETVIIRFSDAAQAEKTVRLLADRQQANAPGEPATIPGFPNARAKITAGKDYLDAWLTDDTTALYVHANDPMNEPFDPAPFIEFTQKFFKQQLEALRQYVPTPADQLASLPIDVDGMLSRTLPLEDTQMRNGVDTSALQPSRAALHFTHFPARTSAAFTDAGVDLVADSASLVYRARDNDSATRLMAALIDQRLDGWTPADSPPNLPGAKCFETKNKKLNLSRFAPTCFLVYDRMVATMTAPNVQQLHQKTAAQYKLLAHK
ncbi:hypothetical protein [Nocardia sp. NPDC051832]|uniref:DUF7373 family lipoprotein n=1 Tax=Nocardia sp. NPDC051832 TaxID=3155673 RepID=UPI0034191076